MNKMQGTTLDQRFEIIDELGRGGMGAVYRAHDEVLNRDVAIKLLSKGGLGSEGRERLMREAQVIAGLNHPNIVQVHDAGELDPSQQLPLGDPDDVIPYIVMELIEGHSLHDSPPRDLNETVNVARQICAALQHAHEQGIVHRDLKPENVLVDSNGTVKLSDFGLAQSITSRVTEEGQIVGTVFYMAPEIARGRNADARADLYSLGVMLYELTAGELPFAEGDALAVISQHLHASVVPPKAKNAELPGGLNDLVVRLLQKQPEDRPASAAAVLEELEREEVLDPSAPAEKGLSLLDRIARGRFVGRERELEEVRSMWENAAGGAGQTLLVSGEPGVGKTRFLRQVATHAEVTGGRIYIGACYQEGGAPYAPFAQIVRQALGAQNADESDSEPDIPEFVLADLLSLTPELKQYYPDVTPNPSLEPELQQQRLFENVVSFFEILSEDAPLLVVMEDAHWGDSSSLSLLRHLARRLDRKPVMLLATYREVELDEDLPFYDVLLDLNRERLARRLKLHRLSRDQTRALLTAIFEEEITQEFLDAVYRETEGNPFFVEEVCKALVESGELYYEDGEWHRPSMADLEIPQSVRVAIQGRVSALPETHQQALRMAAILGREFDFEVLVAASDLEEEELMAAIENAERAQLVEPTGGVRFEFVHALVGTTLAESVHTLRRRAMHKKAAAALEQLKPEDYETLAHHHGEAGNEAKALEYYTQAGDQAIAAYANREAEQHYRAALNLASGGTAQADLLTNLGVALAAQAQFGEALDAWDKARAIYERQNELAKAAYCYACSARAAWEGGDVGRGLEICEAGIRKTGDGPDSVELAALLHEAGRAYHFNGMADKAERYCRRALDMAKELGAAQIQAEALATWAILEGTPIEEGIGALERAIDLAQSNDLVPTEARARNNLAVLVGDHNGELDRARRYFREVTELGRQSGQLHRQAFSATAECGLAIMQGEYAYAEEELRRLRNFPWESGTSLMMPGLLNLDRMEAHLAHFRGEFDLAEERYRNAAEGTRAAGSLQGEFWIGFWHAEMLADLGKFDRARSILEEIVPVGDDVVRLQLARLRLAALESQVGEAATASELLKEVSEDHDELAALDLPWFEAARAQHALASGQLEEGWDHFSEAVRHIERMGMRGVLGNFLMEWADAIVAYGTEDDLAEAERLLTRARDLFEELGSAGYREMAEKKLKSVRSSAP